MRHPTKGIATLAVVSVVLLAAGCNKGPAEAALEAADQALAAAKPEVEMYLPTEFASLSAALQGARAELEKGNYTEALKISQELPAKIQAAATSAAAAKEGLTATWNQLAGRLPGLVQSMTEKVAALAAAKSLPKGMTRDKLAGAQTELAWVTQAWTEATGAFQGGDVPKAVKMAQDVEGRAHALGATLGLAATPAPRLPE